MKISKTVLNITVLTALGGGIVVFSILYLNTFTTGYIFKHSTAFKIATVSAAIILTVLSIIFLALEKQIVYKSLLSGTGLILFFLVFFYVLKISGFLDKIKTKEQLLEYIAGFGNKAKLMFIFIQFLQVAAIPIPGIITISAGAACFGPWLGGLLSFIGIMLGSVVAFFIGRKLGFKAAKWLVGEDELKKWMEKIKGKDRLILTFMFLFPFFPDDVLCFVAGLSSMGSWYFIIVISITRVISIFTTSLAVYGKLIPYNTAWGIALWAAILGLCVYIFILINKHGDKLQKRIDKIRKSKNKRNSRL